MATTTLTAGNDTYNIYIKLDGALGAGAKTSQKGNTVDAGAGIDTLNIDDGYLSGQYTLAVDAAGTITVTTSSGNVKFTNFEKITFKNTGTINLGTAGNDTITGIAGKNDPILFGLGGNDRIDGLTGNDKMFGGTGDDTYVVDSLTDYATEYANEGTDTIEASLTFSLVDTDGAGANGANVENLTLTGTAAINGTGNTLDNALIGNSAANTLSGGDGNDTITGGGGNDTIDGGIGTNDTVVLTGLATNYTFSATQIIDNRAGSDGTDTISNIEYVKFSDGSIVTLDSLLVAPYTGTSGADTITGTTGADTMVGYAGDDIYVVDNAGDVVTEQVNEGTDTVNASITYTLAANVENLTLTGTAVIDGTGNGLGNTITGNGMDNKLDGGTGIDTLIGGAGNDTYLVDDLSDAVTETAGNGTADRVKASITYVLGAAADIEFLETTNTALTTAINLTGNGLAQTLTGNAGANVIDGGAGADTLIGGAGDDTYIVDDAGDVVSELANGGTDTIQSSVTYSLADTDGAGANGGNVEKLTLTGTAAIDATGNTFNNIMIGNSAANILNGGDGDDTITAGGGDDTIDGGVGVNDKVVLTGIASDYTFSSTQIVDNRAVGDGTDTFMNVEYVQFGDGSVVTMASLLVVPYTGTSGGETLTGSTGADTLIGHAGDDIYVVDHVDDIVKELVNEGMDQVQASVTFSLADTDGAGSDGGNVENLTLTGTAAINGTGNDGVNMIFGNLAANTINGGAGADAMAGGNGNDTYFINRHRRRCDGECWRGH